MRSPIYWVWLRCSLHQWVTPEHDDPTYGIIALLWRIPGNTPLELCELCYGSVAFFMEKCTTVPDQKHNLMIFVPTPWTVASPKTLKTMVLNRLQHKIKDPTSPDHNGFTHGKTIRNCIKILQTSCPWGLKTQYASYFSWLARCIDITWTS